MGRLLYILFIKLYPPAAGIAALFNAKAGLWVGGRKNIFTHINNRMDGDKRKRIWVHASSLGEFEQGLPVIEAIRKDFPQYCIVLTFFSPSGYEPEKNNKYADYVFYMPMDGKKNAGIFYDIVQPSLVIFIKYEFWYFYLQEAAKRKTPLLLVSAVFRKSQPFFQWYGGFHREMLQCFTHIFVQHEAAIRLLQSAGINNTGISGDTRFDRVLELADDAVSLPPIELFCRGKKVIVAGSTWLEDDENLAHYVNSRRNYRFIIAPHDIGEVRIKECLHLFKQSIRYSEYHKQHKNKLPPETNTIIIDNIGMLKFVYRYGNICYVGGGFGGDGVHNVLEAAVYNKPVVFGPVYEKFMEATALIQHDGAFSVEDALELEQIFDDLLEDEILYRQTASIAGKFIRDKAGATGRVMQYIQEKRLLTS